MQRVCVDVRSCSHRGDDLVGGIPSADLDIGDHRPDCDRSQRAAVGRRVGDVVGGGLDCHIARRRERGVVGRAGFDTGADDGVGTVARRRPAAGGRDANGCGRRHVGDRRRGDRGAAGSDRCVVDSGGDRACDRVVEDGDTERPSHTEGNARDGGIGVDDGLLVRVNADGPAGGDGHGTTDGGGHRVVDRVVDPDAAAAGAKGTKGDRNCHYRGLRDLGVHRSRHTDFTAGIDLVH